MFITGDVHFNREEDGRPTTVDFILSLYENEDDRLDEILRRLQPLSRVILLGAWIKKKSRGGEEATLPQVHAAAQALVDKVTDWPSELPRMTSADVATAAQWAFYDHVEDRVSRDGNISYIEEYWLADRLGDKSIEVCSTEIKCAFQRGLRRFLQLDPNNPTPAQVEAALWAYVVAARNDEHYGPASIKAEILAMASLLGVQLDGAQLNKHLWEGLLASATQFIGYVPYSDVLNVLKQEAERAGLTYVSAEATAAFMQAVVDDVLDYLIYCKNSEHHALGALNNIAALGYMADFSAALEARLTYTRLTGSRADLDEEDICYVWDWFTTNRPEPLER